MEENLTSSSERGLDIIVFVAQLGLSPPELDDLIERIGKLDWTAAAAQISLVVSDSVATEHTRGSQLTLIRSSQAATAFRDRCRVLEALPHDFLISFGAYLPPLETVQELRAIAHTDEHASAVAPRIAIGPAGELMALGKHASNMGRVIAAKYVASLAQTYHFPEILCPCALLSARMIGNVDIPDGFEHFPDLILAYLRAGRRRGLLVRIENSLVISGQGQFDSEALQHDTDRIRQWSEDLDVVARRIAFHPATADEYRFQALTQSSPAVQGSLLLDCTNTPPTHSGSAEYSLGVLSGLAGIENRSWDFAVMVGSEARQFFSMDARFPAIRFVSEADDAFYDCAIRLGQAWSISTLSDLNSRARSIAVTILDTIGPDVIYAVPEEAEEAFQFAAEHADGLIYISEFSRAQFRRRFATRPNLVERVVHLSLEPAEYASDAASKDPEWILIVGNAYDHKDLERTTRIVSAAFPYEKIKVIGRGDLGRGNVEAFESGVLENDFVGELFARAKCVLFPSFYEGFGLPVIRGLANDKTVIARRSAVSREVLASFPGAGRFLEFENSLDLVRLIGELLQGREPRTAVLERLPSGVWCAHTWSRCAAQILEFAEEMQRSEDVEAWRARDRALRYIRSAR